jgi:hypothetical protein
MVNERFQHLRQLTPIEAAKAWLSGDFGIYDEPAMIEAIRKDPRIKGSDQEITEFFFRALAEEACDPQRCLDELASRG